MPTMREIGEEASRMWREEPPFRDLAAGAAAQARLDTLAVQQIVQDAQTQAPACRYLGPARSNPDAQPGDNRLSQIQWGLGALEPPGRPDLPYPNVAASRIAELEAEVAALKAHPAMLVSGEFPTVSVLPADLAALREQLRIMEARAYIAEGRVAELETDRGPYADNPLVCGTPASGRRVLVAEGSTVVRKDYLTELELRVCPAPEPRLSATWEHLPDITAPVRNHAALFRAIGRTSTNKGVTP